MRLHSMCKDALSGWKTEATFDIFVEVILQILILI